MAIDELTRDTLLAVAQTVRTQAHAPYSRFAVGAAVLDEQGRIHAGCNVENAAYPEGTCAEAGAIAAMVIAGRRRIAELVVAGPEGTICTPCGGCRQKLREFASPETPVRVVGPAGEILLETTLSTLLPHSFGPETLTP